MILWILLLLSLLASVDLSTSITSTVSPDTSSTPATEIDEICTNSFTLVNGECLRYFPGQTNRWNASRTCGTFGATLLTIKNPEDLAATKEFLGDAQHRIWIGIYCFNSSTEQCLWDDGRGSADKWNLFPPAFPHMEIGNCVFFKTGGAGSEKWLSADCDSDVRGFVCEMPSTIRDSNCDLTFNKNCYYPSTIPSIGFDEARTSCVEFCADLVTIESIEEHRFVKKFYNGLNISSIFIGARAWQGKYFRWVDGAKYNYSAMDRQHSSAGNCMKMSLKSDESTTEGYWYGEECMATHHYMCKRAAGSRQKCSGEQPKKVVPKASMRYKSSYMTEGRIFSPRYPINYAVNTTASYTLNTIGSQRIRLHFMEIKTEKDRDLIKIYDGSSVDSKLIGEVSGYHNNLFFESTGNTMFVEFVSDMQINDVGFLGYFLSIV